MLVATITAISATIFYLEAQKVSPAQIGGDSSIEIVELSQKAAKYDEAKEIVAPSGFLNGGEFKIADHIGDKVILIDFWTYSCINCQRTLPYITAWDEKYRDQGLLIVGVHTPEFEFEKLATNVQRAIERFGIKYPVVQDNDYGTWRAYKNRYWPRKYIIDIDGYVVYDHIGEGAYEKTEKVIQDLLKERAEKLNEEMEISDDIVDVTADKPTRNAAISREAYFGAHRNEYLYNGRKFTLGDQTFEVPEELETSRLYLDGDWHIADEFAETKGDTSSIFFNYNAKEVFIVASAPEWTTAKVLRDGEPIGTLGGKAVDEESMIHIFPDQLYHLVSEEEFSNHTLEIRVDGPGVKFFAFTFG